MIKPCWQYHSPIHHHNTTIPQYLLPMHQFNVSAQRTLHHYHRPFYNHFCLYFVYLPFRVLVTAKLKKSQITKGYKAKILKAGNLSSRYLCMPGPCLSENINWKRATAVLQLMKCYNNYRTLLQRAVISSLPRLEELYHNNHFWDRLRNLCCALLYSNIIGLENMSHC